MDTEASSAGHALTPIKQQIVNFYGDQIPGALVEGAGWYVPLHPLTDFLGLDFSAQRRRTFRDDVLAGQARQVLVMAADGRRREQLCLPLDALPGWLFGLTPSRTATGELREKIRLYRAECFKVLWQHFSADILPAAPQAAGLTLAEQAVEQARALLHLAEQQVEFERRLSTMADYMRPFVKDTRRQLAGLDARVTGLEMQISAGAVVTPAEAAEIQLAVKTVANALEAHGQANGYARVYGELYRRYGIASYKQLPRAQYDAVIAWLKKWFDEVGGDQAR